MALPKHEFSNTRVFTVTWGGLGNTLSPGKYLGIVDSMMLPNMSLEITELLLVLQPPL